MLLLSFILHPLLTSKMFWPQNLPKFPRLTLNLLCSVIRVSINPMYLRLKVCATRHNMSFLFKTGYPITYWSTETSILLVLSLAKLVDLLGIPWLCSKRRGPVFPGYRQWSDVPAKWGMLLKNMTFWSLLITNCYAYVWENIMFRKKF